MAKPQKTTNNRPGVSKGAGAGAVEAGGEGVVVGKGGEGEEGMRGNAANDTPPPQR